MSNRLASLLTVFVIVIQFAFILGTVINNESNLKSAQEIIVKLAPRDPRSLLQGDYVILTYDITRATQKAIKGKHMKKFRVVLTPENNIYKFKEVITSTQNYALKQGDVLMNGKVQKRYRVVFGIENYFVEEGTGRDVERSAKYARVKIISKGDAFITELLETVPVL